MFINKIFDFWEVLQLHFDGLSLSGLSIKTRYNFTQKGLVPFIVWKQSLRQDSEAPTLEQTIQFVEKLCFHQLLSLLPRPSINRLSETFWPISQSWDQTILTVPMSTINSLRHGLKKIQFKISKFLLNLALIT